MSHPVPVIRQILVWKASSLAFVLFAALDGLMHHRMAIIIKLNRLRYS